MTTRITTSTVTRTTLADVQRQRARLFRAQEQAASGLRVNRPSDDPAAASAALLLRAAEDQTDQFSRNISQARSRIQVVESSLAGTTDLLLRARELAMTGANDIHDDVSRALIAEEVEALHGNLLSEANRRAASGFVFGGYASDTTPFVASGPFQDGQPAPTVAFAGDSN
ncbi:MAG: flagellar hook-associated protein FlgL, partial [Myxococcales bacterium]|nr:flagellar hook-associated protein FlgL [Myxococcales bacterium]